MNDGGFDTRKSEHGRGAQRKPRFSSHLLMTRYAADRWGIKRRNTLTPYHLGGHFDTYHTKSQPTSQPPTLFPEQRHQGDCFPKEADHLCCCSVSHDL